MNSNITITISKSELTAPAEAKKEVDKAKAQESKPKQAGSGESTTNELIRTALVQAGKQGLQYAVSQYGNLTGNSIGQRNINNGIEVASMITTIAIGGVVGAIAVATQTAINVANQGISNARANQVANMMYERSGNITRNGGRGTND